MKFVKLTPEILKQKDDFYDKWFKECDCDDVLVLTSDDCSVITLQTILGITWHEAYNALSDRGRDMFMIMCRIEVITSVFEDFGYDYIDLTDAHMTVAQFADAHPKGRFAINCRDHIMPVIDGTLYDARNTGHLRALGYFEKRKTVLDREA